MNDFEIDLIIVSMCDASVFAKTARFLCTLLNSNRKRKGNLHVDVGELESAQNQP